LARYREGRQHPPQAVGKGITLVAEFSGEIVGFIRRPARTVAGCNAHYRSAVGFDFFGALDQKYLISVFSLLFFFAKCWWVETSFAIFRVPRMYRQTGFCRFLGFLGLWKINNLPVFSAP
jgi:hypothetical protein